MAMWRCISKPCKQRSREKGMSKFKSWRSYWDFDLSVRRKLRFAWNSDVVEFLDTVLATSETRKVSLKKDTVFWRAQLGHDWRDEGQGNEVFEVPCAHPPDRMKPLQDRASDGRANAKGIPCLYLSNRKETAMSEVRPWIGSHVSVGQFKLRESIEIVDCSKNHSKTPVFLGEPEPERIEEAVWSYIDRAFAEPMTRSDDSADYVATQIIAEQFKRAGLGGIAYKSKFGEDGYNIALFDIDASKLISCSLFEVKNIEMEFSQQDNPYVMNKEGKTGN